MPVNSELMKTMTTRMICQLTPIAAFPVKTTKVADHRVVMIPAAPAMTFCSIVGHARRNTAGPSGHRGLRRRTSGLVPTSATDPEFTIFDLRS